MLSDLQATPQATAPENKVPAGPLVPNAQTLPARLSLAGLPDEALVRGQELPRMPVPESASSQQEVKQSLAARAAKVPKPVSFAGHVPAAGSSEETMAPVNAILPTAQTASNGLPELNPDPAKITSRMSSGPDPKLPSPEPVPPATPAISSSPVSPSPVVDNSQPAAPDLPPPAAPAAMEPLLQSMADVVHAGPPLPEIAFGARLVARSGEDAKAAPGVQPHDTETPAAGEIRPAAVSPATPLLAPDAIARGSSLTPHVPTTSAQPPPPPQGASGANAKTDAATPGRSSQSEANAPANASAADSSSEQSGEDDRTAPRTDHSVLTDTPSQPAQGQPVLQAPAGPPAPAHAMQTASTSSDRTVASPESGAPAGQNVNGPASPDLQGTGTARDIALRLSTDDQSAVEVRLSERGGEVRVAVRTADPQVAESVRAQLPELMDRLGARGFDTQIWRPQQVAASERSDSGSNQQFGSREGGRDTQQQNGGRDERQSQKEPQPEWMEELATSFRAPKPSNRSSIS